MSLRMGEVTTLTKATPKSDSLRTTVPMSIVRQFGLKDGGGLNWEIQAKDNHLVIVVSPIVDLQEPRAQGQAPRAQTAKVGKV